MAGQESAQTDAQTDEKMDGQTDRQTDRQQSDSYIPPELRSWGYSELEFDSLKSWFCYDY